jgi:serine/threonine-protein kinase
MTRKLRLLSALLFSAVALIACGGGSGNSSSVTPLVLTAAATEAVAGGSGVTVSANATGPVNWSISPGSVGGLDGGSANAIHYTPPPAGSINTVQTATITGTVSGQSQQVVITVKPARGAFVVADFLSNSSSSGKRFSGDSGMAIDKAGNLYASNLLLGAIFRVTPTGVISLHAKVESPGALAVDAADNLLVSSQNRILKVAADGSVSARSGSPVEAPAPYDPYNADTSLGVTDFVASSTGDLFVADGAYRMVRKVAPDGTVSNIAGHCDVILQGDNPLTRFPMCGGGLQMADGIADSARFFYPNRIVLSSTGKLVVADRNTLRKVDPMTRAVQKYAGEGLRGYVDGPGDSAKFGPVEGMTGDEAGNVYAADPLNNAIRKITQDGVVSTVFTMGQPSDKILNQYGAGTPLRLIYIGNQTFYVLTDTAIIKLIL